MGAVLVLQRGVSVAWVDRAAQFMRLTVAVVLAACP